MKSNNQRNTLQPSPDHAPKRWPRFSPPQIIALSFAGMILAGTLLLALPAASRSGESIGLLNALFSATSANCVTGLVVVNTLAHWTTFGQIVLLVLIQFGGLGLIAILTLGMVALRRRISLQSRLIIQAAFNQDDTGGMVRLVQMVISTTLFFEGLGAALLAFFFHVAGMPAGEAVYKGLFHAISAFCNAGFDIIGPDSLTPYAANPFINFTIMALIIAGGLGFTVWSELLMHQRAERRRPLWLRWRHLSLHTKMVLTVSFCLIALGACLFLVYEWNNPDTLGNMPVPQKIMAALFQSVTLRTAGFNTIPQGAMDDSSKFLSCLLMMVGGSPAGTAGGIKTVTLGVIVASIASVVRGRSRVEAAGRTLSLSLLQKALAVTGLLVTVVLAATTALHFTEAEGPFGHSFVDLLFETCSAVGTVGVSSGITPFLSAAGKVIVTLCMYIGRLSPVTMAMALNIRLTRSPDNIAYPAESVIIG